MEKSKSRKAEGLFHVDRAQTLLSSLSVCFRSRGGFFYFCLYSTCLTPWTFLIAWLISRLSSFSSNTIWRRRCKTGQSLAILLRPSCCITALCGTLTLTSSKGKRSWKMRLILAPPESSLVSTWSPEPSMHFSKSTPNCCTILISRKHKRQDSWSE